MTTRDKTKTSKGKQGAEKARWPADRVERRPVEDLIPYARNARTHSDEQVAQIAASIREWGWTTPVLIGPDGEIIAGHGRVLAARRLGIEEIPVMIAEGWTEAQKRAYVLADNQLALNAGWDEDLLKVELDDLAALGFDTALIGFGDDFLEDMGMGSGMGGSGEEPYTRKVEAPVYVPTGEKPPVSALYDDSKTQSLLAEIAEADLPDDVRSFLTVAAERHTVFNFRNIAEYYAHAPADVQELMERSALVIIDFNKAVEQGFVKLSAQLAEQYAIDYDEEAAAAAEADALEDATA